MPRLQISVMCLAAMLLALPLAAGAQAPAFRIAAGPGDLVPRAQSDENPVKELSPPEKMKKRFPQPVRVGRLIGMPVLDDDHSTIGYVSQVVRSPDGDVALIVPYGGWFGWCRSCWGKRPIAVPIEVVIIRAHALGAVDMPREDFDEADTWDPSEGKPIPPDEKILVALGR